MSSSVAVFSSHVTIVISVLLSQCFVGSKVFSGIRLHHVFSLSSYAVTKFDAQMFFFSVCCIFLCTGGTFTNEQRALVLCVTVSK